MSEYEKVIYGFSLDNKTKHILEESFENGKCEKQLLRLLKI